MPDQIDLEPQDYRADPIKGERVFQPGGLVKLLVYALVLGFFIGGNLLFSGPLYAFFGWLFSLVIAR